MNRLIAGLVAGGHRRGANEITRITAAFLLLATPALTQTPQAPPQPPQPPQEYTIRLPAPQLGIVSKALLELPGKEMIAVWQSILSQLQAQDAALAAAESERQRTEHEAAAKIEAEARARDIAAAVEAERRKAREATGAEGTEP